MQQSRLASLLEKITDVAIGFVLSFCLMNYALSPFFPGIELKAGGSLAVTIIYTAASFIRGYGTRRLFNRFHAQIEKLAALLIKTFQLRKQ